MEQSKIAYIKDIVEKALILGLVASLFFPIRHVFYSPLSYSTGAYSDFTSISLYLSDILLILLFIYHVVINKLRFQPKTYLFALFITVFVSFFVHNAYFPLLTFFTIKFAELFVLHETFRKLGHTLKSWFIWTFVFLGGMSSIIGILQFWKQSSLGGLLHIMGEPVLNPSVLGVAKVQALGETFIRPYATFPHPNLLAAYLLVVTVFCVYLLLTSKSNKQSYISAILLIITLPGLVLTMSRAVYLGLAVALIIFFGLGTTLARGLKKRIALAILLILVVVGLSALKLRPYLVARATVSDSATKERVFYDRVGLKMIKDNTLFGVGLGTSVLRMQQYSAEHLQPWEIQPIHNYYLIAGAELGVPLALVLISLFFYYLYRLSLRVKNGEGSEDALIYRISLLSILVSILCLMLFDHYFYTIQQTQFLLWIVLGLIASEIYKDKIKQPALNGL